VDGGRSLASLRGRITDAGGGPVEKAQVAILRGSPGQLVARGCSDSRGDYHIVSLKPGADYRAVVRRSRYEVLRVGPIRLDAGTVMMYDVTLSPRADPPLSPGPP
jgi:hypothetical protein